MDYYDIFISVLSSTIRLSIPLIFTALAGLFSERAGIFDIGLEGKMLGSAFAAACVAYLTDSAWLGLGAGIICSVALSLVHGFASITNRGNQIVSGVAINFFIAGITIVLGQAWFGQGGRTPQLSPESRFAPIILPGADAAHDIPIIGPIYANVISGNNVLTYLAFLAVPFSWWVLYRTRFGLRLRAVGENPGAVDTAGISVAWLRYRAVMMSTGKRIANSIAPAPLRSRASRRAVRTSLVNGLRNAIMDTARSGRPRLRRSDIGSASNRRRDVSC